jgi:hypothetical protein
MPAASRAVREDSLTAFMKCPVGGKGGMSDEAMVGGDEVDSTTKVVARYMG